MTPASNVDADNLKKHLRGLDFPAGKEELLLRAESNQAPDDVMATILRMPDREFNDMEELIRGAHEVD